MFHITLSCCPIHDSHLKSRTIHLDLNDSNWHLMPGICVKRIEIRIESPNNHFGIYLGYENCYIVGTYSKKTNEDVIDELELFIDISAMKHRWRID